MSFQLGSWYFDSLSNQYYMIEREGSFYVPVYEGGTRGRPFAVSNGVSTPASATPTGPEMNGAVHQEDVPYSDSRAPRTLPSGAGSSSTHGYDIPSGAGYDHRSSHSSDPEATPRPHSILAEYAARVNLENDERTHARGPGVPRYRTYNVTDQNGTSTHVHVGPPAEITDPVLLDWNIHAARHVLRTPGDFERLDESFRVRSHPRRFFVVGKVFSVLWSQPSGHVGHTNLTEVTENQFGEKVHSKVRKFIVVREGPSYCSAVTYQGQGVAKRNVVRADHAMVFTGKRAPRPLPQEGSNLAESGMLPKPIRVDPDERHWTLHAASRIDLAKVYTIEHNLKVKPFGMVLSLDDLHRQFFQVWSNSSHGDPGPSRGHYR